MTKETLAVGQCASFSKTVTESDVCLFAGVTGDVNPVHIDAEYAKGTPFGGRIAHGMLSAGLISAVIGTRLPGPGTIYLAQELRFIAPVHIGDTVTATVTVTALETVKNRAVLETFCTNQRGEYLLTGAARVFLPK